MEDQESPKRCPLCVGDPVPLLSLEEAAGKGRAVTDAVGGDVLVIARTDAQGGEALRRAAAYAAAGADMIMPVTKTFSTVAEWAECREAAGVPLVATLTASAWTEREFTPRVMEEIGIAVALLPTQVLMAAAGAARAVLRRLAAGEPPAEAGAGSMRHHEFVDMIGFAEVEAAQREYLPAAAPAAPAVPAGQAAGTEGA
jgi:methylisocitrate lyase